MHQTNKRGNRLVASKLRMSDVRASRIESLENRILFATRIWDGGGGAANTAWSNAINWQGNSAPAAGDSITFPSGVSNRTANNDFPADTAFAAINFDGLDSYTVTGNRIALAAGGINVLGSASHTLNIPIALNNLGSSVSVSDLASLSMSGPITGNGPLNKNATGLLTLTGDSPDFAGFINVNGGSLRVSTPLGLGNTTGETSVVAFASLIMATSASGIAENLTISGSGDGNIGALNAEGTATWAGAVHIIGGSTVINVAAGDLTLSGTADNNTPAALDKRGAGRLILSGSAFDNIDTTITAGVVQLAGPNPDLGHLVITNGTSLEITGGRTAGIDTISVTGNGTGAGAILNLAGNNTINGAITLAGATTIGSTAGTLTLRGNIDTGTANPGRNLTFAGAGAIVVGGTGTGAITGTGGITKISTGALSLSGSSASTFTGAVNVSTGNLVAAKATALGATTGATVVSNGAGVKLSGGVSLSAEPLTINGNGVSNTGALGNVTGNNTFAGNITLGSDARIASDAGLLLITGNVDTTANSSTLTVSGAGNVEFGGAGVLSGAGTVNKEGTGKFILSGTGVNTYTGVTRAFNGIIELRKNSALGSTTGNTVTQGPGTVQTASTFNFLQIGFGVSIAEPIVINGSGFNSLGALTNAGGTNLWSGSVNIPNPASIGSQANLLVISGNITGSQSLSKFGTGGVALSGNNSGFTGLISVNAGALNARSPNSLGTTAQGTNVSSGAILTLGTPPNTLAGNLGSGVMITGETLNLAAGATLSTNTFLSISTCTWTGPVNLNGSGTHTINVTTGLTLSGIIAGTGNLTKVGDGTLTVSNPANTFNGSTTVSAGTLSVTGSFIVSATLSSGAKLIGTGSVGFVTANSGSTISPGVGADVVGALFMTKGLTMARGSTLALDLRKPDIAGSVVKQFDLVVVSGGNVNLTGGPTLALNLLFDSSVGDTFKFIDNTGTGTLSGNFDPSTVVANNQTFQSAAVGNDMVLGHTNTQAAFGNRTITSPIFEGQVATLTGHIVDPDPLDQFFLDVNWGDGTPTRTFHFGPKHSRDITLKHRYKDNAAGTSESTFPVSLVWHDQNNGSRSDTLSVVVKNAPPVVRLGGDVNLRRRGVLNRFGRVSDPGRDSISAVVDFGDGSDAQTLDLWHGFFLLHHKYESAGSFEVKVTFTDSDGAVTVKSFIAKRA